MKKVLKFSLVFFLGVSLLGCVSKNAQEIVISKDVETYKDINELVNDAPYIVKGKFVKFEHEWNMQRDVSNPEKESQLKYHEGRVYRFEISEVLKGKIDKKSILINQGYIERVFLTADGELETDLLKADKSRYVDYLETTYIEPDMDKSYVIAMNFDSMFDLYYPSSINAVYEGTGDELTISKTEHHTKQSFKKGNHSIVVESKYNTDSQMLNNISLNNLRKQIKNVIK